ncbi:MAG TPA: PRTRC system ThiF family protein [Armatimonadota bacterium]|nr:PRTRC system ThiF family protein [Armatimonadota bacterium]
MTTHALPSQLLERVVQVDLVGCGGNGSQVLTGLARLDRALRACGHPAGLHVIAWDPDRVTEANVGRQLFYPSDIGESKAVVLVHRLNLCYGLRWEAAPERYQGAAEMSVMGGWGRTRQAGDLLITCVDSAAARREIHAGITEHTWGLNATPRYWLDLGNRQTDGQVILGEPLCRNRPRPESGRLPTVVEVFPELLDPKLREDDRPSCSLAEALESQDLFVNQAVATWALQLLWTLFRRGRIQHHGAFINLTTGQVAPLPVPAPVAEKRIRKRRAA